VVLTLACSLPIGWPVAAEAAKPVVLGMPLDPVTLDPHLTGINIDWNITHHIFDSFVQRDMEAKAVPGLTERWEQVDAAKNTWRFHLRKGVKFHNGEPWNAEVAKWNFERAQSEPKSMVKRYGDAKEVKVAGEYAIDLTFENPIALVLPNLQYLQIVPKKYLAEVGKEKFARNPVGTGPYKFVEWVKDDHITLKANEEYWGGAPAIKDAQIKPVPEPASRVAGLISGDLDVIRGVSVFDTDRIKQSGVAAVMAVPGQRLWHIKLDAFRETGGPKGSPGLSDGKNPLRDARVRKAMWQAINVEELIAKVMRGYAQPAQQVVMPFVWGFNPAVKPPAFDPARAKQLLAEAGFANGFSVRFDVQQGWDVVAEAIANYLGNVGIKATVNVMPNSVLQKKNAAYDVSMVWGGWGVSSVDDILEGVIHTPDSARGFGRANAGRFSNATLDKLIESARAMRNADQQLKAYQDAVKIAADEVGIIPVFFETILAGARKGYEVRPRAYEHVYLQDVKIVK
jgi:peptide/nickel transport system substrate-binding protein